MSKARSFWRHTHMAKKGPGRPPVIEDADELKELIVEYFTYVEENPIKSQDSSFFKGSLVTGDKDMASPFTNRGLCTHIGVSRQAWKAWREKREDLKDVIDWADGVIYDQKFSLAAAGLLNSSFIARDLGLVDKTEQSTTAAITIEKDDRDL